MIRWGHPDFTAGDEYLYTGPSWWLGAGKEGGEYSGGNNWLMRTKRSGAVYFDLDRSILTNNLMLDVLHRDNAGVSAGIDLLDSTGTALATNVVGQMVLGENRKVFRRFQVPLVDYPTEPASFWM